MSICTVRTWFSMCALYHSIFPAMPFSTAPPDNAIASHSNFIRCQVRNIFFKIPFSCEFWNIR